MEPNDPTITVSKENLTTVLDKILDVGVRLAVFLVPLLILPGFSDPFEAPKQIILVFITSLLALCFFSRSVFRHQFTIINSPFDIPLVLLLAISLVSGLLTPNKIFDLSFVTLTLFPLTLLYFLTTNTIKTPEQIQKAISTLVVSAVVIALLSFLQIFYRILGQAIPTLSAFISLRLPLLNVVLSQTFSPTGSKFAQVLFFLCLLPLAVTFDKKRVTVKNLLIVISLVLALISLFANRPILLDMGTSWKIATGTLGQSLSAALFGLGNANYIDAFTLYKPLAFNATALWNFRFATGSSYPLTIIATGGITALAAFIFLLLRFLRLAKTRLQTSLAKPQEMALFATSALSLGILLVFPAPFIILFSLYLSLGLLVSYYSSQEIKALSWENKSPLLVSPQTTYITLIACLLVVLPVIYFVSRIALADIFFNQAAAAALQNRGADTYNLQIKAISLNPWNDSYRVSYSQTNLALADALAGQSTTGGQAITEQQRSTIVQLVQQSIREARNAAALNPGRAGNWENLSAIYRSLVNFAQGADQWAVASQNQAIALDPINPRLRLDLGGIFFSLQNYTAAGQAFSAAASLKNDYPNAHYNLAQAYKMLDDKNSAREELTAVKNLVCNSPTGAISPTPSADCQKVENELAQLARPTIETPQLASPSAQTTNLPKAKPSPTPAISSPSGELKP